MDYSRWKVEHFPNFAVVLLGVVYLQFGDEIKRAMLPAGLEDMSQVQSLFSQTFPDKVKNNGANRKTIYIKDNSCGVFYELDNVG